MALLPCLQLCHQSCCMSTEPTFLPSRDLRDLRTLDLASSECLDSVRDNLTSLARLLGASGGQIVHAPPQLIHSPTQPYTAEEPAVEHAPREVDAFETTYVTRWLSRLVSEFTMISPQDDAAASQAEQLSEQCAALLALSAGRMAAGASVQKHIFQLDDGVLEVQLRDGALIHDSLGTHTWGAAPILSQLLLPLQKTAAHDLKVLELGAGTGLVGLSVAAWARQHPGVNTTHVICTDYHPTVLENLAHNIMLNGWSDSSQKPQQEPKQNPPCVLVTARCLDWQSVHRAHLGQVSDQAHEVTAQTLPDHRLLTPSDADWAQTLDVERLSNTFDMLVAAGMCSSVLTIHPKSLFELLAVCTD